MKEVHHKEECPCAYCALKRKGMTDEQIRAHADAWALEQMMKYGYYVHYVPDADPKVLRSIANIHTHGLVETHGHTDLQIAYPLPPALAQNVLWTVVERIREGKVFKAGDKSADILHGFQVKFIEAKECGRTVLRIILPDKSGNLDEGTIAKHYANQYNQLELV